MPVQFAVNIAVSTIYYYHSSVSNNHTVLLLSLESGDMKLFRKHGWTPLALFYQTRDNTISLPLFDG